MPRIDLVEVIVKGLKKRINKPRKKLIRKVAGWNDWSAHNGLDLKELDEKYREILRCVKCSYYQTLIEEMINIARTLPTLLKIDLKSGKIYQIENRDNIDILHELSIIDLLLNPEIWRRIKDSEKVLNKYGNVIRNIVDMVVERLENSQRVLDMIRAVYDVLNLLEKTVIGV